MNIPSRKLAKNLQGRWHGQRVQRNYALKFCYRCLTNDDPFAVTQVEISASLSDECLVIKLVNQNMPTNHVTAILLDYTVSGNVLVSSMRETLAKHG
jgi:hypothetical protein